MTYYIVLYYNVEIIKAGKRFIAPVLRLLTIPGKDWFETLLSLLLKLDSNLVLEQYPKVKEHFVMLLCLRWKLKAHNYF